MHGLCGGRAIDAESSRCAQAPVCPFFFSFSRCPFMHAYTLSHARWCNAILWQKCLAAPPCAPSSLLPPPSALNPPQPYTLNPPISPQPSTLDPQPSTLDPQPSTFNPLNPQPLNPQSTIARTAHPDPAPLPRQAGVARGGGDGYSLFLVEKGRDGFQLGQQIKGKCGSASLTLAS